MSLAPTSRSPDLQRLRDDGYDLSVVAGLLIIRSIPFVDANRKIRTGVLVKSLDLEGDRRVAPRHHVCWWAGGAPCDVEGRPLLNVIQRTCNHQLPGGVKADHTLCNKPHGREFLDYHELVTTYVTLISGPAALLDPGASARTHRRTAIVDDPDAPFRYSDTATARVGLGNLSTRLNGGRVGIVGLGGTGSYVLDLVAKTPVRAIHLYDHDLFLQHNAFQAPGAAALEDIEARRAKVDHFAAIYSRMHTGIVPHRVLIERDNLHHLDPVDFVFICLNESGAKRAIIQRL